MAVMLFGNIWIPAQGSDPNATEILRLYKESFSYQQSVSMKVDVTKFTLQTAAIEPNYNSRHREYHLVYRRDGNRCEWIGESLMLSDDRNVDTQDGRTIMIIFTGSQFIEAIGTTGVPIDHAYFSENPTEDLKKLFDSPSMGSSLNGNMYGNSHKNMADLLGDSNDLHIRDMSETIDGISCYVLEAETKYGRVTAWIAPEKGYNALKWTIEKLPNDFLDERRIDPEHGAVGQWVATLDSVVIEKINDRFVPVSGRFVLTIYDKEHELISNDLYMCKRSQIELHPDFKSLGAFRVNLPNGMPIHPKGQPGILYKWQDGKIISESEIK